MEIPLLTAAFLFFAGAICHKMVAGFLGLLRATYLIERSLRLSIDILLRVNKSIEASTSFKYDSLVSSGACTEEELKQIKRLDRATLDAWRSDAISSIGSVLPGKLQKIFKVETWRDAERYFKKHYTQE
jgi:hypothetical protein